LNYKREELMKMELQWYWHHSSADCGIKSNWSAMVMASMCPGSAYQDPYDDHRMRSVEKRRQIERVLFAIPTTAQNCLYTLFGPTHLPHSVLAVLGADLAGPALCSSAIPIRDLIRMCDHHLLGRGTPKDKLSISEVRIEAGTIKEHSLTLYRKEKAKYETKPKNG
jgi:hypothetical protein